MRTLRAGVANWKTTIAGLAAGLAVLCGAVAAAFDGDPNTVVDSAGVLQALGGLGMIIWGIISQDAR